VSWTLLDSGPIIIFRKVKNEPKLTIKPPLRQRGSRDVGLATAAEDHNTSKEEGTILSNRIFNKSTTHIVMYPSSDSVNGTGHSLNAKC